MTHHHANCHEYTSAEFIELFYFAPVKTWNPEKLIDVMNKIPSKEWDKVPTDIRKEVLNHIEKVI